MGGETGKESADRSAFQIGEKNNADAGVQLRDQRGQSWSRRRTTESWVSSGKTSTLTVSYSRALDPGQCLELILQILRHIVGD